MLGGLRQKYKIFQSHFGPAIMMVSPRSRASIRLIPRKLPIVKLSIFKCFHSGINWDDLDTRHTQSFSYSHAAATATRNHPARGSGPMLFNTDMRDILRDSNQLLSLSSANTRLRCIAIVPRTDDNLTIGDRLRWRARFPPFFRLLATFRVAPASRFNVKSRAPSTPPRFRPALPHRRS
jgi:hypothetical protein